MENTIESTIESNRAVPTQVRASVNERMFFKSMQHLFASSFTVMGELIQNARRAGASRIDVAVDYDTRTICVTDDGCGIENFEALLDLATSGWSSQEVQLSDKPFGMGFFSAFYACDTVVVYSRRRRLQASRDDIIEHRAIPIVEDDKHRDLTRIELHGVSEQLLGQLPPKEYERDPREVFENKLKTLVAGFPVPVFLNGQEIKRPVAMAALPGEMTEVGFVSVTGIHRGGRDIPISTNTLTRNLWLQGLPIEVNGYSYHAQDGENLPDVVVHLDSANFQARMPDRSHLFDSQAQIERIEAAVTGVIRKHIVQEKARLDPAEFTRMYWGLAAKLGMKHLFVDVPYVPTSTLERCESVVRSTEYQNTMTPLSDWTQAGQKRDLISRQEILDGRVKIWLNAPSCVDEGPWAAVAMKVMQRQDILRFATWDVGPGHWIREIAADFEDLVFEVDAQPLNDRSAGYCWQNSSATIRLAKSLRVHVRSTVDEAMHLQVDIEDDWLLEPQSVMEEERCCDFDYDCWLIGNRAPGDHPVNALATFEDENDHYREEWESDAIKHWDDVVGTLRQEHLANTVGRMLKYTPHIGDERVADCSIVTVQRYRLAHDDSNRYYQQLRVSALDADLITRLCTQLGEQTGLKVQVEDMAKALSAVLRPGAIDKTDEYLQISLDTQPKS
jgi:hypothetical protein